MAWAAVDVTDDASLRTALSPGVEADINLTQDIALTSTLEINRSVTLHLNGYNITADGFRAIWIKTGENVKITSDKPNAAVIAKGAIEAEKSVIRIGDNESSLRNVGLEIDENVTVYTDADKCYGVSVFGTNTNETLVVKGTIHTNNRSAISGNGSAGYGNTTITIGETATITTTNDVAIYQPQSGTLTVNGTVTGAGGIEMKAGNLVIGATAVIKATDETPSHSVNNDGCSTRGYAIAIVENGKYAGVKNINISPEADITGPIATLKDSENSNHNPTFDSAGVQMNVSVTKDGDVKQYSSLIDAVKEVPAGATIQLLNSITINEAAVIDKDNITIDLNGKNVTASGDRAFWVKNAGASITGTGTISATDIVNPDWSVVQVGNESEAASLTVGENVTISTNDCYGITTIGTGESSLTVNGTVTTKVRPAVVSNNSFSTTIGSAAHITTTNEVAVYATGGSLTVQGNVTGLSAVETKGGTLTIDGATLTATATPSHTANNNGTSTRGYAVAIVKNEHFTPHVTEATFSNNPAITGPVATLIDSGTADDPTFNGITMLADINGEHYSSVVDATNIVPSDGTVKLMDNLALTSSLVLDRHASYRLDLDGHNLTATDCNAITIKNGDVIVTNTGAAATISSTGTVAATDAVIRLGDNTGENRNISLGIDNNVTVSTTVCQGVLLSGTNTREALTVKGAITTTTQPAISGDKANGGTTINIEENANVTSTGNVAIYHPQTGTLTVEGIADHNAVVSGTTGIEMKAGDLIVGAHASITATASPATHTANNDGPSTSGYGIAIVENANFDGVGNVDIETTEKITAPVSVAMLVDSKHTGIVEPEFIGNVMLVAEVTGTNTDKYAKLEDAIKQAKDGNTVKMLEDANIASALVVDKKIIFDLNDYTITSTSTSGYAITSSADATIKNGGIIANNCGGIQATSGKLTLQKMTVKASGNSLYLGGATATIDATSMLTSTTNETVVVGNGATLTVDGKIYNTTTNAISGTGTATALTVNSGAIVSTNTGHAIDWQATGTLTVEGGKINGTDAVYASKGNVTINGGTFTGSTYGLEVVNANEGDCSISVEHGTFNSGSGAPIVSSGANAVKHFVKGDYFSKTIDPDLCANGFMISPGTNNNGMYYLISELVITDDTDWNAIKPENPYPIHKAKYIRNQDMGTTHFGTLCLPFSFTPGDSKTKIPTGMTLYTVHEIRNNVLYLNAISNGTLITAGTPVIFYRTGTETSFTIECEDADISAGVAGSDNSLVGKFVEFKTSGDAVYYLRDDCFHKANGELTVPAFRAYIENPTVSSGARPNVLNIFIDDDTEDLQSIMQESAEEMIFDLQGNRQDELKPGMNIVKMSDGRTIKVYVK